MLYGCGLRRFELLNIKLPDIDLDRRMLHIREGKGRKDRYVPIGEHLSRGLRTYIESEKPYIWLFNGKNSQGENYNNFQKQVFNGLSGKLSNAPI